MEVQSYSYQNPPGGQPPRKTFWEKCKQALAPLAVVGALLGKFKAALIPILKFLPVLLKTGGSMFLMIGVYAMQGGWPFAVGFVLLLFVHECGHLVAAKRVGLAVGAPVFIPFMGAFIALKEAPKNAWIEAQVGIGGPLLGSLGALCCHGVYLSTGKLLFAGLAYTGYFLNLFNLAPIGFLDGGRIVTVLSPWLWLAGAVIMGFFLYLHFNLIVLLILLMSLPRLASLFRRRTPEEERYFEATPGQRWTMGVLYFGLAAALAAGIHMLRIRE